MPCSDGGPSPYEENARLSKRLSTVEAILCGIFTAYEKAYDVKPGSGPRVNGVVNFLNGLDLDYKEMGVTRTDIMSWWSMHKYEDKVRRENEARNNRRVRANKMANLEALAAEMGFLLKKGSK